MIFGSASTRDALSNFSSEPNSPVTVFSSSLKEGFIMSQTTVAATARSRTTVKMIRPVERLLWRLLPTGDLRTYIDEEEWFFLMGSS
jgi:hypothetical protein